VLLSLLSRVLRRHIIVYHYVHAFDVNATTENVSAHHYPLLDFFKGTEACDTFRLGETAMDGGTWELGCDKDAI